MADELARINLLTDLRANIEASTEDGTPGIATDYSHRLGWLSGGSFRWGAMRDTDERFASVTVSNAVSGLLKTDGTKKVVSSDVFSEIGGSGYVNGPLDVSGGLGIWGINPPATQPEITGQRTATATLAALYQAIAACGIILDSTTGSSVTREAIIQPLPITNSAPGTVTVVSGGMKSFGFDGNTVTEELFYHLDVQHDYIAAGDMIFHVHWMPATATGGDVKWQIEYQWVEAGATWPAPSTLTGTTAAGTTAWADKRTDITIPGTGHTYNSRLMVRLFRNPTDAADTYTGDAVLSSVGMHYQADPGQP